MTLIDLEPYNEKIYFNLGELSMDDKKFDQAKAWFDKAIKVSLGILVSLCFYHLRRLNLDFLDG